MSALATDWPCVTAVPSSASVPFAGGVTTSTRARSLSASASSKPKSPARNVYAVSGGVTTFSFDAVGTLFAFRATATV